MGLEQTTATASRAAHTLDLMVQVLQHLNHKQRARCAAVCRDWRVAAALVTRSICISKCSQGKTDSLCTWLQANASLAPVSGLELYPVPHKKGSSQVQLRQLPWPQLQHLEVLKLGCTDVAGTTIPARPPTDWNLPFGGAAVPGLTSAGPSQQPPVLQALTCLEVSGNMFHTTGLGHVSSLQHLQRLKLHQTRGPPPHCSGRAYFQRLPASLTHLELDKCAFVRVTASVLSNLTALQMLQVQQAAAADWAALSCLVSLRHLVLTGTPALQVPLQRGLLQRKLGVFSRLTKLQHLELEAQGQAGMTQVPAADAAALTASSQLTALVLRPEFDLLPVDLPGGGLFGAGLQVLPDLVQLCTGVGLLAKPSAMQRLVHRCSNSLQKLDLDPQPCVLKAFSAPHRDPAPAISTEHLAASLAALWELPGLQVLRLPSSMHVRFRPAAWDALAGLTGLTELTLGYDVGTVAEALQLTRLQPLHKLKKLYIMGYDTNVRWHFEVDAKSKAPAGSPSDVWWQAAVDYISSAVGDLGYGDFYDAGDYLQELQLKGKQLVQQLQSQLDYRPQQQEEEEEQQRQEQQQPPQGTAELPAEQRQQLVEAVAAIDGAVQSIQSALDYMEEEAELNKESQSEDFEDDYRGHRRNWGCSYPYW